MLKIRPEHLDALAVQQASGFTGRMALHLREVFPTEVARLDDAGLRVFVERVCVQAEEWGITEEPHVERLIELFVSFDQLRRKPAPEWVTGIVEYPGRPEGQILRMLEDRLLFGEPARCP